MTFSIESFDWFCGVNSTHSLDNFDWTVNGTLENDCFTNLIYTVPHIIFTFLASLVLVVYGCCTRLRKIKHTYLLRYPGHTLFWLTYVLLLLLLICSVGEGILTDIDVHVDYPTQPQLYIPACTAVIAGLLALIYYNQMELWDVSSMIWLLFLYWVTALAVEIVRFLNMYLDDEIGLEILRFDVNIAAIVLYSVFILLALHVIRIKVCGCCTTEKAFPEDLKKDNMHFKQDYANFLSYVSYWWLNFIFYVGYRRPLEIKDLGVLTEEQSANYQRKVFSDNMEYEQERSAKAGKPLSLYRVMFKSYRTSILLGGLLKLCVDTISFVIPVILAQALLYVTEMNYGNPEDVQTTGQYVTGEIFFKNGFVLVALLFITSFLKAVFNQSFNYVMFLAGAHLKAAIQAAVYNKTLRLSGWSMSGGSMNMGQITNHMSVDAQSLMAAMNWFHFTWSTPYLIIGYLYVLYTEMGVAALIGAVVFFLAIPIQALIAKKQSQFQKRIMATSDTRLKQTNEMLGGIKLIKLYGWEDIFGNDIKEARNREIITKMKQAGFRCCLYVLGGVIPILVTLVAYSTYPVLTGKALTPDITFAALNIFNQLSFPLTVLPQVITFQINGYISIKRLRAFFAAPEIEEREDGRQKPEWGGSGTKKAHGPVNVDINGSLVSDVLIKQPKHRMPKSSDRARLLDHEDPDDTNAYGTFSSTPKDRPISPALASDTAVKLTGASFTWDIDSHLPIISDIDLKIPAGKLTMIVGPVGSGKSSLLSAMMGEMTTLSGNVIWNKQMAKIASGSQKAWLLHATLKENILFGNEYNQQRYLSVISACCLQPDIDILPAGDQTEIGEKGINLSGGQKQRVSVARTMYSSNDIVILDDPLSALDAHVGKHLFQEGIAEFLLQSQRTVILVTHQIQYLDKADWIVYMKDGQIERQGTMNEIRKMDPELHQRWEEMIEQIETESESESEEESKTYKEREELKRSISTTKEKKGHTKQGNGVNGVPDAVRQVSQASERPQGKLMSKEERMRGSVSWKVYWFFIKNLGVHIFAVIVFLLVATNGIQIGTNFLLSEWSEKGANLSDDTSPDVIDEISAYYFPRYAALSFSVVITTLLATAGILLSTLVAGRRLHNQMLDRVMHSPMRFFDTTPLGRVLNRFSSDIVVLDLRLGMTLTLFSRFTFSCVSAIIVNAIVSWWFILLIAPISVLYFLIMIFYITTSRELQRLDSITRSPVYALFSETLNGLSTIRAFSQEGRFHRNIMRRIEVNNCTTIYMFVAARWLGFRLDFLGALVVLISGYVTMISAFTGALEASLVGLAITYALQISGHLGMVVRTSADLEMQMNSAERAQFYTQLKNEEYDGAMFPAKSWPDKGDILYEEVSARYAKELDPVLHNVNIHFRAGEKIGICGRTGSGKSSLTLTLFRIIDTFQGNIYIDGVNINHLPLLELRQRLAIIPQDPVLFTGTIRFNLDPIHVSSDDELWEALEIAQLKPVVTGLNLGLDSQVTEGGENFSVGQRQLFCLARAFLRKTKILIMDEATASIDQETDKVLQEVVASAFKDRTVLTIAHRVSTILDADTILVLSDGHIAEYDTPKNLLEIEDSIFASLVKANL
ncbi:ATP-binding cassette sub-family C member 9-like [Amphiura filiformis]|uniref:ATP-binding cassette sub-family C member 9-like n=1 Tax=Amphiura filiformis TaxID=82378 RepID=UPI003B21967B